MSVHGITIAAERRLTGIYYRAVCSCGRYRSGLHGLPGRAERAGRDHAAAKTTTTQPTTGEKA